MEFTTNRRLAFIVLLAVVVAFTLFGVNRSLAALSGSIEDGFVNGVDGGEGYIEKSIQSHLDNRIDAANGLSSLAGSFPALKSQADGLRAARVALMDAAAIPDKYAANQSLTEAADALTAALSEQTLTEDQSEMFLYYSSTLKNAQNAISKLSYNEKVDEYYNLTLKTFPVSILKIFVFSGGPEYFR